VIIGGVLFGVMAAATLLVPEGLWLQAQWSSGAPVLVHRVHFAFMRHVLGLMGDPPHEPL
jgi:hypothetical protein